jgi:hypothetical protein
MTLANKPAVRAAKGFALGQPLQHWESGHYCSWQRASEGFRCPYRTNFAVRCQVIMMAVKQKVLV